METTLSIPMQIIVLRKVKFYLLREKRKDLISDYAKRGLCYYVFKALKNLSIHDDDMFKYNPEGTRYGALMNKISYSY